MRRYWIDRPVSSLSLFLPPDWTYFMPHVLSLSLDWIPLLHALAMFIRLLLDFQAAS